MSVTEERSSSDDVEAVLLSRRTVNDAIAEAATRMIRDEDNLFEFLCECGDGRCRELIKMTLTEFWATGPGSVVKH